MAQTILQAIEGDTVLVAEAGTGTGKTLAYLVPALLAGGKVIVTTGTKTLQDQLYDRDLPAVRAALASGAVPALLKGRANYVCLHRLERAVGEARLASREEAQQLRRIERFAAVTTSTVFDAPLVAIICNKALPLRASGPSSGKTVSGPVNT